MENYSIKGCHSALITPTNMMKFQFPPQMPKSADRLQVHPNFDLHAFATSRRTFTPNRNSLFLKSPDLSPIDVSMEFNIRRALPETVDKGLADTTIKVSMDDPNVDEFILMPPPKGKPRKTSNFLSVTRERSPQFGSVNGFLIRQELEEIVNLMDDILNTNVSLTSLLRDTGLTQYIDVFEREAIDLEILLTLTDQDLQLLGIRNADDRDMLLKFKNIFESSFS